MQKQKTEILIIGSGLAGSIAALTAAQNGKKVTIITKERSIQSGNTQYAQGGIVYKGINDNSDKLKADIINAGDNHCWEPAVNQISKLGPELVESLLINHNNIQFDYINSKLDLTFEAAHSEPRIIHHKDQTGKSIQNGLLLQLTNNPNINILTNHMAIDILTLSHHSLNSKDIYKKPSCFGAMILDNNNNQIFPFYANKTILSTGGLGQLFSHTTNPLESTGDGIAMAWRAGARCFNMQYIQFHPTTLFHESGRFLISESLRGEGAKLIDHNGNTFMKNYHQDGSLAPRDVVARGIHQTMLKNNKTCVYLDISNKKDSWISNRFPNIVRVCKEKGFDITKEPIPVVPASHYSCGGIGVNLLGRTSLKRLYAIGEVSCTGAHGANRLASTSLLESLVWGYTSGKDAANLNSDDQYFPEIDLWSKENKYIDPAFIAQSWLTIKNTMWNYVGLVRTRNRLSRAQSMLKQLQSNIDNFYQNSKITKEVLELRNGIQAANAIVNAALESRESRGTHYLEDCE